jgi:MFS family permease
MTRVEIIAIQPVGGTGLAKVPESRRNRSAFWSVGFAFLAVTALSTAPSPLYSIYEVQDGLSGSTLTIVYAFYGVGVIASLLFAGHLSDWYGRRRMLLIGVTLSILSAAIFLLSTSLPALLAARFFSGLSVGIVVPTATAYVTELGTSEPRGQGRRGDLVALSANVGGLGLGALIAGLVAEYVNRPLLVPYAVFLAFLLVGTVGVVLAPETHPQRGPKPPYHVQKITVAGKGRSRYLAAALGATLCFATFGLFAGLSARILAGTLHEPSPAASGLAIFLVFGSAVVTQISTSLWPASRLIVSSVAVMLVGLAVLVGSVYLPTPNLTVFLIGGVLIGVGGGGIFRSSFAAVLVVSSPDSRAEALAGFFLAGYIGLSAPIVAIGVALQHFPTRATLLAFSLVIGLSSIAVALILFGSRSGIPPPALASNVEERRHH